MQSMMEEVEEDASSSPKEERGVQHGVMLPLREDAAATRTSSYDASSSSSTSSSSTSPSEDVGGDGGSINLDEAAAGDGEEDDDASTELAKMAGSLGDVHLDDGEDEEDEDHDHEFEEGDDESSEEEEVADAKGRGTVLSLSEDESEEEDDGSGQPTLRTVARWLREGSCSRVLVLSGAGVSVSAGIPDFRTPGTGLYDNLQRYNLPYPEAVFDVNFYRTNPSPFVSLAKEIWPGLTHEPTITHSFVRLLQEKGLLLRNYTQNIDGLEVLSGVSPDNVLECHGHFRTARCIECKLAYDGELCKREILEGNSPPICPKCTGYVKPDIVFFGEGLPESFFRHVRTDLSECDLLIVMGTSLTVQPVSLIPQMLPGTCPRLLFNRELVGDFAPRGEGNFRDVFEAGDCDDSARKLCRLAGWEEELLALNESTRSRKDKSRRGDKGAEEEAAYRDSVPQSHHEHIGMNGGNSA